MRRLFKVLIIVIFIPSLVACTMISANNMRKGIDNFRVENYRKAFIYLKPEAEKGQPDAQYAVGYMYYYGQGIVEDRKKAWFWMNTAAHLGQPEAKKAIAILASGGSLN